MVEINIKVDPRTGQVQFAYTQEAHPFFIVGALEAVKQLIQTNTTKPTEAPAGKIIIPNPLTRVQ